MEATFVSLISRHELEIKLLNWQMLYAIYLFFGWGLAFNLIFVINVLKFPLFKAWPENILLKKINSYVCF